MDKVQKIREKVEKRYEYWKEKESNSHSIESEIRMSECQHLLLMLDSMQEEPKFKTGDRIKPIDSCLGSPRTIVDICDSWYVTDQGTLDFEYEDNWELIEEPVSEELETELNKYIKNHFTIDTEQLDRFGIEEKDYMYSMDKSDMFALVEHFTNWQKQKDSILPMDLGEYINELSKQFPEVSFAKLSRIAVRVAKWQRQQDQSTIELAEDHAMLAGMEKMKEEMMIDAIDVTVHIDSGGYPYIPQIELYDYDKDVPLTKEGDRYKVILIKEK